MVVRTQTVHKQSPVNVSLALAYLTDHSLHALSCGCDKIAVQHVCVLRCAVVLDSVLTALPPSLTDLLLLSGFTATIVHAS